MDEEEAAEGHEGENGREHGEEHPGAGPDHVGVGDEIAAARDKDRQVDGDHDPAVDAEDLLFLNVLHLVLL